MKNESENSSHPTTVKINLKVGEHPLKFTVPWDQEKYYRDAQRLLNARFKEHAKFMQKSSSEQIWVQVALEIATNLMSEISNHNTRPIDERITELTEQINKTLNNNTI